MVQGRNAYFKNVNQSVVDASQNETLNTLINQVASKAEQADLTSGLAQKADSSAVTYALSGKADVGSVTTLASDLVSEVSAREGAIVTLSASVDDKLALKASVASVATKLATSVYDARIVNEAVFYDSVKNSISLLDVNNVELDYVALGLVA
jgi:hypothetical protein